MITNKTIYRKMAVMLTILLLAEMILCHTQPFAAELITHMTGNIFYSPDNVELSVVYKNSTETKVCGTVEYSVKFADETNGKTVFSSSVGFSADAKTTVLIKLPVNNLPYGVFELRADFKSESGDLLKTVKSEFSVINKPLSGNEKLGVNVHLGKPLLERDAKRTVELAKNAGITFLRGSVEWPDYEQTSGNYVLLDCHKNFINQAIANDMEILLILTQSNPIYDNGNAPTSDAGLKAYRDYAENLAKELRGKVKYFEVCNEYDLIDTHQVSEEEYLEILKAAYRGITNANEYFKSLDNYNPDDDAVIVGLGGMRLNNTETWIKTLFENGAADYMDIASAHFYDFKFGGYGALDDNFDKLFSVISDNTEKNVPVWITETGWPNIDVYQKGNLKVELYSDEQEQASILVRTFVKNMYFGIDKWFCYDFEDDGTDEDNAEHNFGLVNYGKDDSKVPLGAKASYAAIANMNSLVGNFNSVSHEETENKTQIYGFNSGNATNCYVLWNDNGVYPCTMSLDAEKIAVFDLYGNKIIKTSDNGSFDIEVSQNPVYVKEIKTKSTLKDGKGNRIQVMVSDVEEFKNKDVVCQLLKPGKSVDDAIDFPDEAIAYFDIITADATGSFKFDFCADSYGVYTLRIGNGEKVLDFKIEYYLDTEGSAVLYLNGNILKAFSEISDGDVLNIKVTEKLSQSDLSEFTVICAMYSDNEMVDCVSKTVTKESVINNDYDMSVGIKDASVIQKIKVLILENLSSVRPVLEMSVFSEIDN